MTTITNVENGPYVVVTNSGGVSEVAEVGGDVETLHIDYDDCNDTAEEAERYADEVMDKLRLPDARKLFYVDEIFEKWPEAKAAFIARRKEEEAWL